MNTRVLGEKVPISIPTAVPVEEKLLVEKVPVNEVWINLSTLFRNLYESYEDQKTVPRGALIEQFIEEAEVLKELLNGIVDVIYYTTDSTLLVSKFPEAKIKIASTAKQKLFANAERLAINALITNKTVPVIKCKLKIPGNNAKAWMMTHHPLDLMSRYEFSELTLLNSHTGELKKPIEWITKLTANEKYLRLPFNLLTIQVIGDKATQFMAHTPTYRKALLELANTAKWKPTTTRSKILHDLDKLEDKDVASVFKKMINVKLT